MSPRNRPLRWWRSQPPVVRWGGAVVAGLVMVEFTLAAIGYATGGSGPQGPPLSSYSTTGGGLAAYASLLRGEGRAVTQLRTRLDDAGLDAGTTVVLLGPDRVTEAEAGALRNFLAAGGRVVAGGPEPAWLGRVLPDPPAWTAAGATVARPLAPVEEVAGVRRVRTAGRGSWTGGSALPLLAGQGRVVASVAAAGSGRVVLLADASMLSNRRLDRADNAAFGLAAAGRARPVLFAEAAHGYVSTGWGALPARWRAALVGLAGAALVWLWAMGRRLGPPEAAARSLPPPRHAFVDAQAINLARTGSPEEAIAPLKKAATDRLRRRAGLAPSAGEPALRAAAVRFGLTDEEASALLSPVSTDAQVLAAGRAAAKLARPREAHRPGVAA